MTSLAEGNMNVAAPLHLNLNKRLIPIPDIYTDTGKCRFITSHKR